ncbi:hypothetical protein [Sphingomonas fennica]|uniref:hypothetical protein n=1 Tax=Edaphosphingomonas fennica TaxID=114404 RepID=UPI001FE910FB|nr:hypothetical protein [Sphingomonas fennica]
MLVGGAAVELYSSSAVNTGDFDIVTPRQQWFEEILQRQGFVKPAGPGMATRGWIHPDLKLGFEIVSSSLLDGSCRSGAHSLPRFRNRRARGHNLGRGYHCRSHGPVRQWRRTGIVETGTLPSHPSQRSGSRLS